MGVGSWALSLNPDTPGQIKDVMLPARSAYGHIVVTPTWVDLGSMDDATALSLSRYTGIYLARDEATLELSGYGVNAWLGDGQKGRSTGGTTKTDTFANWAAFVTPAFLGTGTRSTIAGNFKHIYDPTFFRELADAVAARYDAAWRVTPDFQLDFGTYDDLFREDPVTVITRSRLDAGRDFNVRGVHGDLNMTRDVEDWARRVVYFYDGGSIIQTGGVSDLDAPFRGPTGDPAFVDRVIVDMQTDNSTDATALALAEWRKTTGVRDQITLSAEEYDIGRDVQVGDNLHVFDRDRGIFDLTNPLLYRGQTIYPQVIRCVGYTWPVRAGMGVWFRHYRRVDDAWVLTWTDLTPFVRFESGETTVEVGAKPRQGGV